MSRKTEDAVRAVLTRMAERIAATAPRGWRRAELRGYATDAQGSGHHGWFFEPDVLNRHASNPAEVFDDLRELHTAFGATDRLTAEVEVMARGRYRAVLSERLERTDNRAFRYLFDRHAPRPEPGELLSHSVEPEAGDPGEAVALLRDFLRRLQEIMELGKPIDVPPPAPPGRRLELESELGLEIPLPQDLEVLYATADGDGGAGLFHGFQWFDLDTVAHFCDPDERWWVTREWQPDKSVSLIRDFGPPLAIRRLRDHPAWIPFATDAFGNFLAVDMAPGPRGHPGQVILIGQNQNDGPTYVADSVTSLLRTHVNALTTGAFESDDEDGGLWVDTGGLDHYGERYEEACTLQVSGPNAAPVRGLTDEHRELTVSDAPWVDLEPVRRAPALWRVSISNCPVAALAPLADAPIELLSLSSAKIDLTGLGGHTTLQQLVLRTEGEDDLNPSKKSIREKQVTPVDLSPLVSCPRLYALDLTEAAVADYSVLREATGLRHLSMRRPQWDELVRQRAVPPSLAIADLTTEPRAERRWFWSFDNAYKKPRPTLSDAVAWSRRLAGDAADVRMFRGRFAVPRRRARSLSAE